MSLRQWFGRSLITLGRYIYGPLDTKPQPIFPDMKLPPVRSDAVVEATEDRVDWQPEQHGNVVIAEPDIMTQFRREKHNDVPGM